MTQKVGYVTQVIGPVVDVIFEGGGVDLPPIYEALEIERFFRSGWYSQLTSVDGEYLIKRLQEEIRQSKSIRVKRCQSEGNKNILSEVAYEQKTERRKEVSVPSFRSEPED